MMSRQGRWIGWAGPWSAASQRQARARDPQPVDQEPVILQPAASQLRTTQLDSWHAAPGLPDAWQRLLQRCPDASVFQTLPFNACWWRAFGAAQELALILAWSGSRLIGVAPMMLSHERGRLGGSSRTLRFIGSHNHAADYCDFLVDPEYPKALDALIDEACRLDADRIDLSHLPGHSRNRQRIEGRLQNNGMRVCATVQNQAPVRLLCDKAADRKAANKTSLKRNKRHFEKLGRLRYRRIEEPRQVLDLLPAFFAQHQKRWAGTDWPSQFHDPLQRKFYRDIVRELLPNGWLTFDVVMLDEQALAFHLGFEFGGRFIWYKPTFDIRHAPKSPGQVLLKYLLERAVERNLDEFDFTIGGEGFKHRFANQVRHIDRVVAFRSAAGFWQYRSYQALKTSFGKRPGQ